jgi:hypothetical protein
MASEKEAFSSMSRAPGDVPVILPDADHCANVRMVFLGGPSRLAGHFSGHFLVVQRATEVICQKMVLTVG